MAFDITVQCSGELHKLHFTDKGDVVVDPALHDAELEAGLVALGGEPSQCFERARFYRNDPIAVMARMGFAVGFDVEQAYVDWAKTYAAVHLGCDAVVHASQFVDPQGAVRKQALHTVRKIRAAYPFVGTGDAIPIMLDVGERYVTQHCADDAKDLQRFYETRTAPHELAKATTSLCYLASSHSYSETSLACVTTACCYTRSEAKLATLTGESYVGQYAEIRHQQTKAESRWQARQLIRGISRLIGGNPWPSF